MINREVQAVGSLESNVVRVVATERWLASWNLSVAFSNRVGHDFPWYCWSHLEALSEGCCTWELWRATWLYVLHFIAPEIWRADW